MQIKAYLRKRHDKDIRDGLKRLNLEDGERSDIVREGVRIVLRERGVLETVDDMRCLERRHDGE